MRKKYGFCFRCHQPTSTATRLRTNADKTFKPDNRLTHGRQQRAEHLGRGTIIDSGRLENATGAGKKSKGDK